MKTYTVKVDTAAERKLVVLNGLNIKKMSSKANISEYNDFLDALAHLEEFDYNNFVLVLPDGNITEELPKKAPTGALKELSEVLQPVKFESPTPQKLALWALRHFEHQGIKATQADCTFLVEYCAKDMFTLSNEVEKLCIYAAAHGNKTVSANDVNEICSSSIESDAFAISNAIIEKNTEKAFLALMDMKQERVDAGAALAQLARTYADLMSIALLAEEGKGTADIAAIMKFHPYKLGLYLTCAKKLGKEKISQALSRLIKTDALSKSGGISGFEAVEIFISQSIGK